MTREKLRFLLYRYSTKTASPQEEGELMQALADPLYANHIKEWVDEQWDKQQTHDHLSDVQSNELYASILKKINIKKQGFRIGTWARIAIAASIILVAGAGLLLLLNKQKVQQVNIAAAQTTNDISAPDSNRAILRLADGSIIYLDSAGNGTLATEGNAKIVKTANGQLMYDVTANKDGTVHYNTLTNPRGSRVISIMLADGSKVWLNAASSIKYFTAAGGNTRDVEITGEAYFEVAKNATKPFHVKAASGIDIEVLGTHFNVMSYDDEKLTKTTLAEGKVKVTYKAASVKLSPAQQARFTKNNEQLAIQEADVNKELAWKEGIFQFEEDDLPGIMRQFSRWYDVEVSIPASLPDERYTGLISKDLALSQVLQILKLAGINYTIEGKRLTIKKI